MSHHWHQTAPDWSIDAQHIQAPPNYALHLTNLRGSWVDMANDYAPKTSAIVDAHGTWIKRALLASPQWRLANTLDWWTWRRAGAALLRQTPKVDADALNMLTHQPQRKQYTAYHLHELLAWLRTQHTPQVDLMPAPASGMSIVMHHTNTYHVHILEVPQADIWSQHAEVICYHPSRGLSFAAISSQGLFGPSYQAMNEAGIVLSVHPQHHRPPDTTQPPLRTWLREILTQSHSLSDAIGLLKHRHAPSRAMLVITDGDHAKTAIIELQPGQPIHITTHEDGTAVFGPELHNQPLPSALLRGHQRRRERAQHLQAHLQTLAPESISVQRILDALTLQNHPTHTWFDTQHPTIANANVVIFDPAQRRLWVSVGPPPAVSRWLVPITLKNREGAWDTSAQPIKGLIHDDHSHHAQQQTYAHLNAAQRALLAHHTRQAFTKAELALAHAPDNKTLMILTGLLALRDARWQRAQGVFRGLLTEELEPSRRAQVQLYLSWCLSMQSSTLEAKRLTQQLINDPALPVITRQRLRRHSIDYNALTHLSLDLFEHSPPLDSI